MAHGIEVSRPGYDVKTATPQQMAMSSRYSGFKIAAQGSTTVTIGASGTLATTVLTHNLGYIPAFLCFAESQNGGYEAYRQLVNDFSLEPGTDYTGISAYTNAANLTLRAERDTLASHYPGAKVITVYYYLFIDPAA
jgi:hypothetical protein